MHCGSEWRSLLPSLRESACSTCGCNDGFFLFACRRLGASEVVGVEVQEHFYDHAVLVNQLLGLGSIKVELMSAYDVGDALGQFDVTLALGLIYHLKSPFQFLERSLEGSLSRRSSSRPRCATRTKTARNRKLGAHRRARRWSSSRIRLRNSSPRARRTGGCRTSSASCSMLARVRVRADHRGRGTDPQAEQAARADRVRPRDRRRARAQSSTAIRSSQRLKVNAPRPSATTAEQTR